MCLVPLPNNPYITESKEEMLCDKYQIIMEIAWESCKHSKVYQYKIKLKLQTRPDQQCHYHLLELLLLLFIIYSWLFQDIIF
jgi:hypothetical protein